MHLNREQREWLSLALVPGVGTTHFIRLLARYRTPGAVLAARPSELREVVGPKLADRIAQYSQIVDLAGQERLMAEYDATLVTMNDTDYPPALSEIYDPPLALFVRGELRAQDAEAIAIVGTRRATPYGIRMAEKMGRELAARGITIVSGMALGIDAAAHRGAIEAGGRTIAVLGNGVDVLYPRQNAELMDAIIKNGCVVSQFSMGTKPSPGHFPYRNRIISGMSKGTVVVQAPLRSGALITAHVAAEQGREVFAIPGEVGNRNSAGPHALLREGAKLVETAEDVLVELQLPVDVRLKPSAREPEPAAGAGEAAPPLPETPAAAQTTSVEEEVLSVLSGDGSFVDEIAAACRIPVSDALSSLTLLELKGLVRQFSGKRFAPR